MATSADDSLVADKKYLLELKQLFRDLKAAAVSNIEYFQKAKGSNNERFFTCFSTLWDHLQSGIEPAITHLLEDVVKNYDCDKEIRANGYRSVVKVVQKCCLHLLQLSRHITITRETMLFRGTFYSKELEAFVTVLGQLRACIFYIQKLSEYCINGQLFPDVNQLSEDAYDVASNLMVEIEALCQEPFYGRCLGFHYCSSMKMPLTTVSLAMASFGDGYQYNSAMMKFASSMYSGSKYMMDPELRAKQFVKVSRSDDIAFCKAFWSLAENSMVHNLPLIVCPPVQVDLTIEIQPDIIELTETSGNGYIPINPPCAHSGPGPVSVRLISYELREGQESWLQRDGKVIRQSALPPTSGLIIHVHGGGFVSQSSASHEVYLRQWAKDTHTPILSVDYSLAPELPFPRQLEEVFFAYCWAMKNAHLLGTSADYIAVVGDSAGGNLSTALAMRCAQFGIRIPDGVLSIYGVFLVQYAPSPSRILSLMDPLLPLGLLSQVLAAYSGVKIVSPSKKLDGAKSSSSAFPSGEQKSDSSIELIPQKKISNSFQNITLNDCQDVPVINTVEANSDSSRTNKKTHLSSVQCHRPTASRDSGYQEDILSDEVVHPETDESLVTLKSSHSPSAICATNTLETHAENFGTFSDLTASDTCSTSGLNGTVLHHPELHSLKLGSDKEWTVLNDTVDIHKSSPAVAENSNNRNYLISKLKLDLSNFWGKLGHHSKSTPSLSTLVDKKTTSKTDEENISPFWSCNSSPSSSPELGTSPTYAKMRHFAQSPVDFFKHLPVLSNPYISPLLAPDNMINCLCPMYLIACHLDPLLDDSVTFAKRLIQLGRPVYIDIIDDLAHGFLNFVLVCPEARRASDLCVKRLRQILCLEMEQTVDDETWLVTNEEGTEWLEMRGSGDTLIVSNVEEGEDCVENWSLGGP